MFSCCYCYCFKYFENSFMWRAVGVSSWQHILSSNPYDVICHMTHLSWLQLLKLLPDNCSKGRNCWFKNQLGLNNAPRSVPLCLNEKNVFIEKIFLKHVFFIRSQTWKIRRKQWCFSGIKRYLFVLHCKPFTCTFNYGCSLINGNRNKKIINK